MMKSRIRYCNVSLGLLITAILFILGSGCGKDKNSSKPCSGGRYSFEVSSEFSPQKEVYNVGDTITFTSSFPKVLYDNVSIQNVDYSNSLGIGGNFNTAKMDTVLRLALEGLNNFEVINFIGTTSTISNSPNLGVNIRYIENQNNYVFKLGIKLKFKGLYYVGVTDLGSQGITGKDCTNAGFAMTVTNTNKNINLFQYALNYTPDAMLQKSIYCFRVQ